MDKYNKDFISLYSVNDISNIYIQNTGEYNKFLIVKSTFLHRLYCKS